MITLAIFLWILYFLSCWIVRVCDRIIAANEVKREITWMDKARTEMDRRSMGPNEIMLPNQLTGGLTRLNGARKLQEMRPKNSRMN